MKPIYLDYQATTPVDERVLAKMLPYFCDNFGNPSSVMHSYGNEAEQAVKAARKQIAKSINAKDREIIFTSGATEACNLAIKGVADAIDKPNAHFITVSTEHKAVLDSHKYLEAKGFSVTYLPVLNSGLIDLELLKKSIRPETTMISVMMVNNEIGTIQDIASIGEICAENNIIMFTDATQALGKIPIDVKVMNIHLLACSAHKIYGPKGIGALYIRSSNPRIKIAAQAHGGGQERGLRSGTLNVPGIVGFGEAVTIACSEMKSEQTRLQVLRDEFLASFKSSKIAFKINGALEQRIPGNLNLMVGVEGEALMVALRDDLAISTGSACTSTEVSPSHVLQAIGLNPSEVSCSIRIGFGRQTTQTSINQAYALIYLTLKRLSALN